MASPMSNQSQVDISVVIPILNEEGNLTELFGRLRRVLRDELKILYEVIFVDDGSEDNSWGIIEELHMEHRNVKGIKLSRNFGHQYAIKAGLDNSIGKVVVSIDGDLQHPPELITSLYSKWKEGYAVVYTIREETKGLSRIKKSVVTFGYWIINMIADVRIDRGAADFRLLDRKVVNDIVSLTEKQLFLRGLVNWFGYRATSIKYVADERYSGAAKYSLRKSLGLGIAGIMSFSAAPLRLSIFLGFLISVSSFAYGIYIVLVRFIGGTSVPGWTTTTFAILSIGGMILMILGIIGEYIAKIYEEVKQRPNYIVEKQLQ